jgi:histidyl-tRNA synthetase
MTKRNLKKSLDYANKEGIPFVIILGEEELKSGLVKVKDMQKGEEKIVSLNEGEEELVRILDIFVW